MSTGQVMPTPSKTRLLNHYAADPTVSSVAVASPAKTTKTTATAALHLPSPPRHIQMDSPENDSGLPPEVCFFTSDSYNRLDSADGDRDSGAETPLPEVVASSVDSEDEALPPLPESAAPELTVAELLSNTSVAELIASHTVGSEAKKPRAQVLASQAKRAVEWGLSVLTPRPKPSPSDSDSDTAAREAPARTFRPLAEFVPGAERASSSEDDSEGDLADDDQRADSDLADEDQDDDERSAAESGQAAGSSPEKVDGCTATAVHRAPHSAPTVGAGASVRRVAPADVKANRFEPPLKFRTNYAAVRRVLLEAGWEEWIAGTDREHDFNLWWKVGEFRPYEIDEVDPWQRINHFPTETHAICKKDKLARILRKMQMLHGRLYGFMPQSFILPKDHAAFVETHAAVQREDAAWICKPSGGAQGRGIYVFRDADELEYSTSCVVQRYIERPLLVDGFKFDLRVYVAVTNYHPLTVYIYREGLARFSTQKYDMSDLSNQYAHLTNTSINKASPNIDDDRGFVGAGCKRTFAELRKYLAHIGQDDRLAWQRTASLIVLTLLAIVPDVPQTGAKCVELMGFDVLFDENLRPWLLEVNYAPSLTQDVAQDAAVKAPLLVDTMALCNFRESDGLRGKPRPLPQGQTEGRRSRQPSLPRWQRAKSSLGAEDGSDYVDSDDCTEDKASTAPVIRLSNAYKLRMTMMEEKKAVQLRRAAVAQAARDRNKRKLPSAGTIRRETSQEIKDRSNFGKRLKDLPERVGDYQLVFPFNESTLEMSCNIRKRYDAKQIITEIRTQQARLKARLKPGQDKGVPSGGPAETAAGDDLLFLPNL